MSAKSEFAQGTVHKMKDGLLEVTEYISSNKISVRFIDTGFVTVARAQHLRNGEVKDHRIPSKKDKIKARAEHNRTADHFLVIESDGKEVRFNNANQIAEHYNISRATVYNILRGDYGTRTNLSIQYI